MTQIVMLTFALLMASVVVALMLRDGSADEDWRARRRDLDVLARKLRQGRSRRRGASELLLRGRIEGHLFEVRVWAERGADDVVRSYLQARVQVTAPLAKQLRIERETPLKGLAAKLGARRDVQIGDAHLDRKYLLNGEPRALARLLSQHEAEQALDWLLDEHQFDAVVLQNGWLGARREADANPPDWVEQLLLDLVQLARACDRKRVQIQALGEQIHLAWTGGSADARCPYCRESIAAEAGDLAVCEACDTVHHQACLDEGGGCAIFGCEAAPAPRPRPGQRETGWLRAPDAPAD